MSRDMLGATGFESTNLNLETLTSEANAAPLKGTAIGGNDHFEQKVGKSDAVTIKENTLHAEEDEFTKLFKTVQNYKVGDIISGYVSKIVGGVIYVDIAYKAEGIVEADEISNRSSLKANDVCNVGDRINVKIMKLENKAGNPVLSKKRADYELAWEHLNKALRHNEDISVRVVSVKEGGVNADFEGILGFIPANQFDREDLNRMESLTGQTIYVKVLKANRNLRKVIFSHKASREKTQALVQEALKKLNPGDVLDGTVRSIKSFGAFVSLGEFDGLIHISELSWSHVEKVEDVLQEGQEIKVYVIGIDQETSRISLSLKRLANDPWVTFTTEHKAGDTVPCTITRLVQFGAFAELVPGVEGLIHLTELSENQVKHAEEVVKPGDKQDATILRIDTKNRKIGLTLRQGRTIETTPSAEIAE